MNTASLTNDWQNRFNGQMDTLQYTLTATYWNKTLFAQLHYLSTHLCLRLQASSIADTVLRKQSSEMLADMEIKIEKFFWGSVIRLGRWEVGPTSKDESELVRLCFGATSPIQNMSDQVSFREWREHFETCLSCLSKRLISEREWNKWTCMALHFAAFYIDLYQQQEIQLQPLLVNDSKYFHDELNGLKMLFDNPFVLSLIKVWIDSKGAAKSSSGLPLLASPRARTGQFISVRSPVELLIQQSAAI
jgi:hypothetical protein